VDRKWWTLIAVCTGVFMLLLDITIVNVALPQIQHGFRASLADLQWVIDAYALALAALLLTAGSIADLAGRRRVFAVGIVVFTLGSLLCGLATDTTFLSLARGVQGIGGAIMFATSLALLAQAFKPSERGVAFGVFGAVTGVAVAVGPVLGGAITSGLAMLHRFFGESYRDMRRMEELLAASELDWTVVRPPMLTNKPATGHYRTAPDHLRGGRWITRADLAASMLDALDDPATSRAIIGVSN